MTAFKTAQELGIKQWEHDHLFALMNYLRTTPEIKVTTSTDHWSSADSTVKGKRFAFDMSTGAAVIRESIGKPMNCGSVGCIGGHIYLMEQGLDLLSFEPVDVITRKQMVEAGDYVHRQEHGPLSKLFYPRPVSDWSVISPAASADAIENYLTCGSPEWKTIAQTYGYALAH